MLVEEDNNPIRCKRIWTKLWAISSDIVPSNMATFGGFVGPLLFFFSFFFLLSLHFIPPTLGDLFQIKYIFFIEKTNYVIICFFFFIFENYICFTKFLNYDFQIFQINILVFYANSKYKKLTSPFVTILFYFLFFKIKFIDTTFIFKCISLNKAKILLLK